MSTTLEQQVIIYITANPGCATKDISKGLNIAVKEINRRNTDTGYPGVYKIPGILEINRHFFPKSYSVSESDSDSESDSETWYEPVEQIAPAPPAPPAPPCTPCAPSTPAPPEHYRQFTVYSCGPAKCTTKEKYY